MAKLVIEQHYVNLDGKVIELKKGDEVPAKFEKSLIEKGYAEVAEEEKPKPRSKKAE